MRRSILTVLTLLAVSWALAAGAQAAGGTYTFAGGTPREQATVRQALNASSFDWGLVPGTVTIHLVHGQDSYATPGDIWLDADLVDSGRFGWATIQHEFAHQVDFFLLDDAKRAVLGSALQTTDWCYGVQGLQHAQYGCERFASLVSWAYWQTPDNALRPTSATDEAGAMAPAAFRALLATLISAPSLVSTAPGAKAFAPQAKAAPHAKPAPQAKAKAKPKLRHKR
jgi:hypothetical protein